MSERQTHQVFVKNQKWRKAAKGLESSRDLGKAGAFVAAQVQHHHENVIPMVVNGGKMRTKGE